MQRKNQDGWGGCMYSARLMTRVSNEAWQPGPSLRLSPVPPPPRHKRAVQRTNQDGWGGCMYSARLMTRVSNEAWQPGPCRWRPRTMTCR